jgi:ERCC4-type nuclease
MIIIDTREQKPLWDPKKFKVLVQKLDEGDYTTDLLLNKAHAERKSAIDLYGSLIQNHKRFAEEIQRAIEKDLSFAVFVECTEKNFIAKKFDGGFRLNTQPEVLAKIVGTFTKRYPVQFIWCKDRDELRNRMCIWFANQMEELGIKSKIKEDDETSVFLKIGDFETDAEEKTFSTGKEGYGFYGKVEINGRMHQVSFNAVNIDYL